MRCKLYNSEGDCMDIEKYTCGMLEPTSVDYEVCMINLYDKIMSNSTRFCVNHYNNLTNWQDNLHPKFVEYHRRKYGCLNMTGVPFGR
jgi:hypothetical protein